MCKSFFAFFLFLVELNNVCVSYSTQRTRMYTDRYACSMTHQRTTVKVKKAKFKCHFQYCITASRHHSPQELQQVRQVFSCLPAGQNSGQWATSEMLKMASGKKTCISTLAQCRFQISHATILFLSDFSGRNAQGAQADFVLPSRYVTWPKCRSKLPRK